MSGTALLVLLLLALPLRAGAQGREGPALLGGADELLQTGVAAMSFNPAHACRREGHAGWLTLSARLNLRNDDLSIHLYNEYIGQFLDESEKRELMDRLGGTLGLDHTGSFEPFGWRRALPVDLPWGFEDFSAGYALALQSEARAVMDTDPLRVALFGNDPREAIRMDEMGLKAILLQSHTLNLAASRGPLRLGMALDWHWGRLLSTRRSGLEISPPEGSLSAEGEHLLLKARGHGMGLDLGGSWTDSLAGIPLRAELVIRDFLGVMHWGDVREQVLEFHLPEQPISSEFEFADFEEQLVDSSYSRRARNLRETSPPRWILGLAGRPHKEWTVALRTDLRRASRSRARLRRFSVYGGWQPPHYPDLQVGLELASGYGRGLSLGGDLHWQRALSGGRQLIAGLGFKSYNGLFSYSRGIHLGWTIGLLF